MFILYVHCKILKKISDGRDSNCNELLTDNGFKLHLSEVPRLKHICLNAFSGLLGNGFTGLRGCFSKIYKFKRLIYKLTSLKGGDGWVGGVKQYMS